MSTKHQLPTLASFPHKSKEQKQRLAGRSKNMSNAEICTVFIIPKYQDISYTLISSLCTTAHWPSKSVSPHTLPPPLLQVCPLTPVTRTEACNLLLSLMRPILPFSHNQTILPADKKQVQGVRKRSSGLNTKITSCNRQKRYIKKKVILCIY